MIEYYEAFLKYFMGLSLSGQIITGILIIMGLVTIGYIIYGTLWITYQSIKFSIVVTVIIVYLGLALLTIIISVLANEENIGNLWSKASLNIQKIISGAYNFDKSQKEPVKPIEKKSSNQSPPVIIIKKFLHSEISDINEENFDPIMSNNTNNMPNYSNSYDNSENEKNSLEHSNKSMNSQEYCPNCGNKFTSKMLEVLNEVSFTFCELCGEKFYKRDANEEIYT